MKKSSRRQDYVSKSHIFYRFVSRAEKKIMWKEMKKNREEIKNAGSENA